jgi:hypothetical protein
MEFQTNMIASFIVDRCPVSSAGCLRGEAGQISGIEAKYADKNANSPQLTTCSVPLWLRIAAL